MGGAAQWIGKSETVGEELQRRVFSTFIRDRRIERIADNRKSNRSHMNSKLVLLSGLRKQSKFPEAWLGVHEFDIRNRIDSPFYDSLAIPRFPRFDSVLYVPMVLL